MTTQLDNKHGRRVLLVVALIACVALVALARSASTPAAGVATKTILFSLTNSGKGRWSIVSATERGSVTMNYNWHGNLRFKVSATVLANPNKRFSIPSSTTLFGGWVGDSTGTRSEAPNQGPYHCSYRGTNVRGIVTAVLTNGTARGTMQIVLTERGDDGFFPSDGHGATVSCSNAQGASGPSHFEPQWLFRDEFADHGQMSSKAAFLTLPTKMLQRGSASLAFPKEVGQIRKNPLLGDFTWDNRGTLRVSSRPA
jgi:hypothetical protein